jgi:hypothetical protein
LVKLSGLIGIASFIFKAETLRSLFLPWH